MSKPKNTSCATVQGQKWTKPNTKKWNVQKVTRPFFFRTKGRENKKAELVVTTTTQTNKRKGKKSGVWGGKSDSAFKDKHTMHLMETGAGLVT